MFWACAESRGEDVKNPKNHFRPFCSGNLLSAKPFQPESHKTIFRIFREILGGWVGEGVADFSHGEGNSFSFLRESASSAGKSLNFVTVFKPI
jgi:hypothetical protein